MPLSTNHGPTSAMCASSDVCQQHQQFPIRVRLDSACPALLPLTYVLNSISHHCWLNAMYRFAEGSSGPSPADMPTRKGLTPPTTTIAAHGASAADNGGQNAPRDNLQARPGKQPSSPQRLPPFESATRPAQMLRQPFSWGGAKVVPIALGEVSSETVLNGPFRPMPCV
jgi:hypothetical protein